MKIAFIVDPLAGLKAYKDSTIFMMREAAKRGHSIYAFEAHELFAAGHVVSAKASHITVSSDDDAWVKIESTTVISLDAFDAVLMRKDPPFDNAYLHATLLLSLAAEQGVNVVNNPQALRDYNEKLAILKFSEFIAPTLVTSSMTDVQSFIDAHGDTILKKLDGMGGTSIFRVRHDDVNRNAIVEVQTENGNATIMAQRYIPAIEVGDKRVLVIDGVPMSHALARIPKAGETRGNLAAGGRGVAMPLTARERTIAEALAPRLKADGLTIVGLDIIGDYLTEVNVTSPTCMVEIFAQSGVNIATAVIDAAAPK